MQRESPSLKATSKSSRADLRNRLEELYRAYHKRCYVHPDPLELLYRYAHPADQEIAGIVCSSLAYGRVAQILSSASRALAALGDSPAAYLRGATPAHIRIACRGFVHRFTREAELAELLVGVKRALHAHGSLEGLFAQGLEPSARTLIGAQSAFVRTMRSFAGSRLPSLLPSPEDGSACKRLNLFLRWMVRHDEVDPGPWRCAKPAQLIVPLDTHLFRLARALGLTDRRQPNLKTALDVTAGFTAVSPEDPLRYDFCLTRLGIRDGRTDNPEIPSVY